MNKLVLSVIALCLPLGVLAEDSQPSVSQAARVMNWNSFHIMTVTSDIPSNKYTSVIAVCLDPVNTFEWATDPVVACTVVYTDVGQDGKWDQVQLTRWLRGDAQFGITKPIVTMYNLEDNGAWIMNLDFYIEKMPIPEPDLITDSLEMLRQKQAEGVHYEPK